MPSRRIDADVAVVGAGPAGIAAACLASERGRSVAVLDQSPWLGGQIWRGETSEHLPHNAARWIHRFRDSRAIIHSNATVFAAPTSTQLRAETPDGTLNLTFKTLVLATGARELFIPFPGWTLPGVLGPGGLHALAKSGWPVTGKRVVVAGSGPLLLAVAEQLRRVGARIPLIAEQAAWAEVAQFGLGLLRHPGKLFQGLVVKSRLLGVPYQCGCWPLKAEGAGHVERVTLTNGSRTWQEPCDYLACGFHLVPNLELPRLLGCEIVGGTVKVDAFQRTSVPGVFCAGEPTGVGGADCALAEGQIAGLAAAGETDRARALFEQRASWHDFRHAMSRAFALRPELRALPDSDTIFCRCEDVPMKEVTRHASWRDAKLQTRCGMGSCQGRVCGAGAQFLFGWNNDSVRPPIFPVRVESLREGKSAA